MEVRRILSRQHVIFLTMVISRLTIGAHAIEPGPAASGRSYQIIDGRVDVQTYNGFRRYHAGCNHCHGPDGIGSTVGPSLIDRLLPIERFRDIVLNGVNEGSAVMKGFSGDPNVSPYLDDIYAYLQARTNGALGRGRPDRLDCRTSKKCEMTISTGR